MTPSRNDVHVLAACLCLLAAAAPAPPAQPPEAAATTWRLRGRPVVRTPPKPEGK